VIDRIHIEQLEVHGRVGVPDSERVEPQRLSLNVTLLAEDCRAARQHCKYRQLFGGGTMREGIRQPP
jgi:dihydroneopterin aldolase